MTLGLIKRLPLGEVSKEKRSIAPIVKRRVDQLLVSFASPAQETHEERVLLVRTWAEKTAEFETEVVSQALDSLLSDNPRNPWRPTPQDIVERCRKVRRTWLDRAADWYCGEGQDPPPSWATASLVIDALSLRLLQWSTWRHPSEDARESEYPGVTIGEHHGWHLAKQIGPRIAEWPQELLQKFNVLRSPEFERVDQIVTRVDAEREEQQTRHREWASAARAAQSTMRPYKWNQLTEEEQQRCILDELTSNRSKYPALSKRPPQLLGSRVV